MAKTIYTEEDILKSKTPMEYIDRCLKSKVSWGEKSTLALLWQKKTGHTNNDIKYARNRHPYWKARKLEGNTERTRKRMATHKYMAEPKHMWSDSRIKKFLKLNHKINEKFIHRDWEIAQLMETTIAGVQAWRRKYNLIMKLFSKMHTRPAKRAEYIIPLMRSSETTLRAELRDKNPAISNLLRKQRTRK
jgi:TPP-dependent indolepyruvate ferredoxin oxidoreductase alpha subunit